MSHHTGIRLFEVGALLITIAGAWFVASAIPQLKLARTRMIVAGSLLAAGGILFIVSFHWGKVG